MKASIELDIAYDDTLEDALRRLMGDEPFGISATVVDTYGPGGGWPLVQFTGTVKEIVQLVTRYCPDAEDALSICEAIELVE